MPGSRDDMRRSYRIGLHIFPSGPYWVQVNEAVAVRLGESLVSVDLFDPHQGPALGEDLSFVEHIEAQQLDALICVGIHAHLLRRLCDSGLPIVYLFELDWSHPRIVWPSGLYQAGYMAASYVAQRLGGQGRVLAADGYMKLNPDAGASRMAGIRDALALYPAITLLHSKTSWHQEEAFSPLCEKIAAMERPPDAVIGLDDDVALAARDAARSLGIPDRQMLTVGINGDPLALAAILQGSMNATVRTAPGELAAQAAKLAFMAVRGEPWPQTFDYHPLLVTSDNVQEVVAQSLSESAMMPSRLVGVNRRAEQDRLKQLELSTAINRRVAAVLDRQRLIIELEELIRANYGYDIVRILHWTPGKQELIAENVPSVAAGTKTAALEADMPLVEVLRTGTALFIPDAVTNRRWSVDTAFPLTRTRMIVPIRLGDEMLGLLDLHSLQPRVSAREELVGLQATADHLAIAMRNAELYGDAVRARAAAEKADQLKTRLLANVSHELRTPLNIIMGYSKTALAEPNPYAATLPAALRADLDSIYRSGEHLIRLINDLLDLSRAEIGELDLFVEAVPVGPLLRGAFKDIVESTVERADLTWRFTAPESLPTIEADPVRLRQVLLNLLHNAAKFTQQGTVTLGAEIEPPQLHLWVADTGPGIPPEQQELIFQPFAKLERTRPSLGGAGLGLSITRRLVALHGGAITLESQPDQGSTFHVYLPLPTLSGRRGLSPAAGGARILWVIGGRGEPAAEITELAERMHAAVRRLGSGDDIAQLAVETPPSAIAWIAAASGGAGWEQVERLRAHPQLSQLPFILYTPHETGRAGTGVTNLLTRPASQATLLDAIAALRPGESDRPILIVDDDRAARELTLRTIEHAFPGAPTLPAEHGREAVELLQQTVPALLVLDLVMPEMDGFAVLDYVRRDPRTRGVPVVVLSGKLLTLDELLRLNHAGAAFVRKGILDAEEQAALLKAVLDRELLPQATSELVKRAVACIHESYALDISRDELAKSCGVSAGYLSKIFRQEMGLSVTEYLVRLRIQMAQALLLEGRLSVTDVATATGFNDPAYFSRVFHKLTGQSAREYRRSPGR